MFYRVYLAKYNYITKNIKSESKYPSSYNDQIISVVIENDPRLNFH